jgi:hypothetical protein
MNFITLTLTLTITITITLNLTVTLTLTDYMFEYLTAICVSVPFISDELLAIFVSNNYENDLFFVHQYVAH